MNEPDNANSVLRSEVGRAVGFVVGALMLSAQDGRLPTPAELQRLLDHYRRQFKAFTPDVEEVVTGVMDGLGFAMRDQLDGERL